MLLRAYSGSTCLSQLHAITVAVHICNRNVLRPASGLCRTFACAKHVHNHGYSSRCYARHFEASVAWRLAEALPCITQVQGLCYGGAHPCATVAHWSTCGRVTFFRTLLSGRQLGVTVPSLVSSKHQTHWTRGRVSRPVASTVETKLLPGFI